MAEAVVRLRVDASGATRALKGVQAQTNKLQSAFGGLRTAIGGIGLTLLAKNAINTSTSFEKLNVRLGLLTKASGTFARSQEIAADAENLKRFLPETVLNDLELFMMDIKLDIDTAKKE